MRPLRRHLPTGGQRSDRDDPATEVDICMNAHVERSLPAGAVAQYPGQATAHLSGDGRAVTS